MMRQWLIPLTIFTLLFGCAAQQPPTINFTSGTRVGILNKLESSITHLSIGALRFDSFTRTYDVAWNIPHYIDDRLSQTLSLDPRYSIVLLKHPSSVKSGQNQKLSKPYTQALVEPGQFRAIDELDPLSLSRKLKPNAAKSLTTIADKNDLDVIIIIQGYKAESSFKLGSTPVVVRGYGLLTSSTFQKHAFAYANISIAVFATRPMTYIGSGRTKSKVTPLDGFNWQNDIKNLPLSELGKLRAPIQKKADRAVKNALKNANLI
jgi:hypothetical protein